MLRRSLLVVLALCVVGQVGCILVPVLSPRAPTVLRVQQSCAEGSEVAPMGLKTSCFAIGDHGLALWAAGSMPDEHRTYIYGYPFPMVVDPCFDYRRLIEIRCAGGADQIGEGPCECRVWLLLERGWPAWTNEQAFEAYEGEALLEFRREGERVVAKLHDLRLDPASAGDAAVCVGGAVSAKHSKYGCEQLGDCIGRLWEEAAAEADAE